MAAPDKVFKQTYAWYAASIDHLVATIPAPQQPAVKEVLWQALGGVSGIGAKKLERYGPTLVELVGKVAVAAATS